MKRPQLAGTHIDQRTHIDQLHFLSAQNKRHPSQFDSSPRTGRPCTKQQKLSDNLPDIVIIDRILPFVDRSTWDNLVVANREIYEGSRNLEAPWPVGEDRGVGDEQDGIKPTLLLI
jgi:hypothetical protein